MSFHVTEPKVSIVIPVHNGGESFRRCLLKLAEASPAPYEVIVVADGDSDGSWQLAEDFGAQVIRLPMSGGPARARNVGAKAAMGEILFFVDADVEIYPDTVGQVSTAFQQNAELAALIGSYDDAPGASNFLSQYRNLLHHYVHQIGKKEAFTFWGACGAIRRDVFLAMDGFDESYRKPCIEDIELGYRLCKAGHKIELHPSIQVKHLKRWDIVSMLRADVFYRAIPWTALLLRDRQFKNDLNLSYASRLSVVLTFAIVVALLGGLLHVGSLAIAAILSLLLLLINVSTYQFFWRKRGLFFAVRVIPWHWFYYFYGGLAFGIGLIRYHFQQVFLAKTPVQAS
jgi:glycosyltransferase involved in cell wall biosynthesis